MKVYVVFGEDGAYSDYSAWVEAVCATKGAAEALVAERTKKTDLGGYGRRNAYDYHDDPEFSVQAFNLMHAGDVQASLHERRLARLREIVASDERSLAYWTGRGDQETVASTRGTLEAAKAALAAEEAWKP